MKVHQMDVDTTFAALDKNAVRRLSSLLALFENPANGMKELEDYGIVRGSVIDIAKYCKSTFLFNSKRE